MEGCSGEEEKGGAGTGRRQGQAQDAGASLQEQAWRQAGGEIDVGTHQGNAGYHPRKQRRPMEIFVNDSQRSSWNELLPFTPAQRLLSPADSIGLPYNSCRSGETIGLPSY